MKTNETHFTDEDFWQAFRYVAGEMSGEEQMEFEALLETRLSLCLAVAEASALTLTVAVDASSTKTVPSPVILDRCSSTRGRSSHRRIAAVISLASCLILAVFVGKHTVPTLVTETTSGADAELLVAAWADGIENQEATDAFTDEEPVTELQVPDWMLAAVTLSEQVSDDPLNENTIHSGENVEVF